MKVIADFSIENINDFEVLSKELMNNVRGGVKPPKTRDKDVFEFEED
ncbi:hypothetical protein [uncultured Draconibacterium sp.]|nr:hypothetical protein [uncultured Draconibacterium sp.]